jgi:dihydrofolate reductase
MIVAVSPDGVIGLRGTIPWHYKGDMLRFKRVTMGKTIVMGRATWDSLPKKPLPGRRNVVITSRPIEGVESYASIERALEAIGDEEAWFIGGARIYEEAMKHVDVIDVTYVPDRVDDPAAVRMPAIDEARFSAGEIVAHEDEPALTRRTFTRRDSRR